MGKYSPFALIAALCCAFPHGVLAANTPLQDKLAAGAQMMQQNSLLLRNQQNGWQRIREGFQIDDVDSNRIRFFERQYSLHVDTFKRTLGRGQRYLYYIMGEVEKRGLPTELALLPMVESAFNPQAVSSARAAGLWQFMPATGQQYGLEQTWWYDGRRDVTAATQAALDYLETLYTQFGDWRLALAAYNWGEGNLSRAIAKNQARGLATDFDTLTLPRETRDYVPKLLAIRNILRAPDEYNIELAQLPNTPYFTAVKTDKHMDLSLAARLAGVSEHEFLALNPAYNRPVYAYKNGRELLIPVDHASVFTSNLATYDQPLLSWQAVTASSGDTVGSIASRYGMSSTQLRTLNALSSNTLLIPGQLLLVSAIPNANNSTPDQVLADSTPTIEVLANTENATETDQINPIVIPVKLAASLPANKHSASHISRLKEREYVVQRGDTLFSIARKFGIDSKDIRKWNDSKKLSRLHPGYIVTLLVQH